MNLVVLITVKQTHPCHCLVHVCPCPLVMTHLLLTVWLYFLSQLSATSPAVAKRYASVAATAVLHLIVTAGEQHTCAGGQLVMICK